MTFNPTYENFTPSNRVSRVYHKMPDGGITAFNISLKHKAKLRWENLNTQTALLQNIHDTASAFVFIPEPTATSWNAVAWETLWTNDFNFTYDDNSKTQGLGGEIILEETAGG